MVIAETYTLFRLILSGIVGAIIATTFVLSNDAPLFNPFFQSEIVSRINGRVKEKVCCIIFPIILSVGTIFTLFSITELNPKITALGTCLITRWLHAGDLDRIMGKVLGNS